MVGAAPTSGDRIAFLGHSTVLIEMDGTAVLTDPVLRGRVAHLRRDAAPADLRTAAHAQLVLVSHLHHDHLDLPSLRRLGASTRIVVPRGAGPWLRSRRFEQVTELALGETLALGAVSVTAVPARHDGRRRPRGPSVQSVGYVMRGTHTVYFAGDTELFAEMSALSGGLDVALLPVAGWGATLGPGHMGPRDAARAARLLKPRLAIPIHWGTLRPIGLGRRHRPRRLDPPHEFARELARDGPEIEVRVLEPGQQTTL